MKDCPVEPARAEDTLSRARVQDGYTQTCNNEAKIRNDHKASTRGCSCLAKKDNDLAGIIALEYLCKDESMSQLHAVQRLDFAAHADSLRHIPQWERWHISRPGRKMRGCLAAQGVPCANVS
eukprot:6181733-Pleurochrysis_carterae.AAC.1